MTVGFYFDMTRCIGCRACQVACKDKNRLEVGTLYREVHSFTVGKFPEVRSYSHTFGCNHCEDAICLKNCPTGAIYKAADGNRHPGPEQVHRLPYVRDELPVWPAEVLPRKGSVRQMRWLLWSASGRWRTCMCGGLPKPRAGVRRFERAAQQARFRFGQRQHRCVAEPRRYSSEYADQG